MIAPKSLLNLVMSLFVISLSHARSGSLRYHLQYLNVHCCQDELPSFPHLKPKEPSLHLQSPTPQNQNALHYSLSLFFASLMPHPHIKCVPLLFLPGTVLRQCFLLRRLKLIVSTNIFYPVIGHSLVMGHWLLQCSINQNGNISTNTRAIEL